MYVLLLKSKGKKLKKSEEFFHIFCRHTQGFFLKQEKNCSFSVKAKSFSPSHVSLHPVEFLMNELTVKS